jgi:hypothetical protein
VTRMRATPAEFQALMAWLEPVDPDRRGPIAQMMFEVVGDCPICEEPVRRCDARDLTDAGMAHPACTGRKLPPDPPPERYEEAKRKEERKLEALREEIAARKRGLS